MSGMVVMAIATAGSANAATVSLSTKLLRGDKYRSDRLQSVLELTASTGETNNVTISASGSGLLASDRSGSLVASVGCASTSPQTATCASPPGLYLPSVDASLGDGDDRLRISADVGVTAAGGPGSDVIDVRPDRLDPLSGATAVLDGGPGDDVLMSANGADTLQGGPGADHLYSGGANDVLEGDPPAGPFSADVIDGGNSPFDAVTYSGRRAAVRADLLDPRAPAGGDGEGDRLIGIEDVTGGLAGDTLRGDEQRNQIDGGAGTDTLVGLGGDDSLRGSLGADTLIGGAGNDVLDASSPDGDTLDGGPGQDLLSFDEPRSGHLARGAARRISCGSGHDLISNPPAETLLRRDCEAIKTELVTGGQPRRHGSRLRFYARLQRPDDCRLRVTVRARSDGPVIATATKRMSENSTSISAPVTPTGEQFLRRRSLRLRIDIRSSSCGGRSRYRLASIWTTRLR